MSPESIKDARGHDVFKGDTVGGVTSGRYQGTIFGPVIKIGKGQVKVACIQPYGGQGSYRPGAGDKVWISASRIFLLDGVTCDHEGRAIPHTKDCPRER